ncbi:MAG: glycosyltransferase family 39 protein [Pyrinomonadaceae bacterium]|nr:glycosyltransferase family 39 protein [Pyrinomonadaceae bacterium]
MEDALKQKLEAAPSSGAARGEPIAHHVAAIRKLLGAHWAEVVCAALLLLMAVNLCAAISRKTITNDEIVHIPAGYYHLVAGEFQLNNEHPPLIKMWAALPLLFVQPDEPPPPPNTDDENFMERTWGFHARFWQANRERFAEVTFWPRVMMIPITLALGVLIFVFARKLFGETAALIAVALYVLEPTVLAHGRIVHTDLPAAFAYLLFFFTLHYYAETLGRQQSVDSATAYTGTALLLGFVCGVALLTKFSMVVLLPVLIVCLGVRLWRTWNEKRKRSQALLHAGLVAAVILFLVNAAFYFTRPPLEASDVRWVALKSAPIFSEIITGVRVLSKVIPTYYLFGLYNVLVHGHYGHATSLMGQYNDLGWWYYFPVAFALKTTIPLLLIIVLALGWTAWRLLVKRDRRFLILIVPVGLYAAIALTSNINIGIRHFLPVYPFLFILGGAFMAQLLQGRNKLGTVLLVVLFGWMSFEAARTFPNYTPYMNQLASRHPHWYYLSDSNVEWGDDVGELAAYLKARGETRVSAALSGGWSTLAQYGVEYLDMVSMPKDATPETRYVAIGASFLNGSVVPGDENVVGRRSFERMDLFARYRNRKPEAVFGNSIYLFREHE